MAHNLCYSTIVIDPNIPDEMCNIFDVPNKSGIINRYRFIKKEHREGILPVFLRQNKEARTAVKKQQTMVPYGSFTWLVLKSRQLNIKLSSNGTFGYLGSPSSKTPCYEAAECVTYIGRQAIEKTVSMIQDKYLFHVIYGDSVTSDTPILIRENNVIKYITISSLMDNNIDTDRKIYKVSDKSIDIWSDKGWTKIKYIMSHKVDKPIYQIITGNGLVNVTEDHSLITHDGSVTTINQIKIGDELLHKELPILG
jgi:DNA polymerase elongation subunit (family B)